jgi:hydroxycarboxylate dehydrogenase B
MVIEPAALENWVARLLRAHGADAVKAARVAAALVDADRCGHSSHGVRQLPYYVDQIEAGALLVDADPLVVDRRGGLVTGAAASASWRVRWPPIWPSRARPAIR